MDASSSLRVEKTKLKTVIKKSFVLDTNVLLHDPTAVAAFAEHAVVIPMTVLEELDHISDTGKIPGVGSGKMQFQNGLTNKSAFADTSSLAGQLAQVVET